MNIALTASHPFRPKLTLTDVCKSVGDCVRTQLIHEHGHIRNSGAHSPTHDLQCATLSSSSCDKAQRKYRDSFWSIITSSESSSGPQTVYKILQINRDHSVSASTSRPADPARPDCPWIVCIEDQPPAPSCMDVYLPFVRHWLLL